MGRQFKRYVFLPGFKSKLPRDSLSKKDDEAMYHAFKNNKELEHYGEKGLAFNLINAAWIYSWQKYISGAEGSKHPGRIKNLGIAQQIMDYRLTKKHAIHDNGVPLREPKDVYVLSHKFFIGFAERYGVDVEIKLVRYESVQDLIEQD